MSNEQQSGAVMIAATAVLRGHKTRIGKIGGNITLPRAVELTTLVAIGVGAVVGMTLAAIINPSFKGFMYAATFGGALGYFVVNYSPLQGESLFKWLGLTLNTKRQQIKIDGQPVRLAIGVAYVSEPARGAVRITKSAVNVPPSQFDERGVQISAKNRNLPEQLDPTAKRSKGVAAADRADRNIEFGVPLPANADISLETKAGKASAAAAANKVGGLLGKLSAKEKAAEEVKAGRLAAARAAQEAAAGDGLGVEHIGGWVGRQAHGAQEVHDPFAAPPQHLPDSDFPKSPKSSKPARTPKVPTQGGPKEQVDDPFAGKPKKLPR